MPLEVVRIASVVGYLQSPVEESVIVYAATNLARKFEEEELSSCVTPSKSALKYRVVVSL